MFFFAVKQCYCYSPGDTNSVLHAASVLCSVIIINSNVLFELFACFCKIKADCIILALLWLPGHESLLYLSWHDSAWIPILNQHNVMDYFSERSNPFYDRQCNNEVIKMQRLSSEQIRLAIHVTNAILYQHWVGGKWGVSTFNLTEPYILNIHPYLISKFFFRIFTLKN